MSGRRRERPILEVGPLPLDGRVTVTPVERPGRTPSASEHGWSFEVRVGWFGPPLPSSGLPPVPGGVAGSDVLFVPDRDRAVALGQMAADELRVGRLPELRKLAARR